MTKNKGKTGYVKQLSNTGFQAVQNSDLPSLRERNQMR